MCWSVCPSVRCSLSDHTKECASLQNVICSPWLYRLSYPLLTPVTSTLTPHVSHLPSLPHTPPHHPPSLLRHAEFWSLFSHLSVCVLTCVFLASPEPPEEKRAEKVYLYTHLKQQPIWWGNPKTHIDTQAICCPICVAAQFSSASNNSSTSVVSLALSTLKLAWY